MTRADFDECTRPCMGCDVQTAASKLARVPWTPRTQADAEQFGAVPAFEEDLRACFMLCETCTTAPDRYRMLGETIRNRGPRFVTWYDSEAARVLLELL